MPAKTQKKVSEISTVNTEEISQFDSIGAAWWDESGPMRPLHRMNPARMGYLRDRLCAHYDRPARGVHPLQGLRVLDIGCGGGLIAEPLARMGAQVTGIDAGKENIRIASDHAADQELDIDYLCTTAENLAARKKTFDAVLALEIIEHVENPALFVKSCCALVRQGGVIVFSTLNRTPKSWLMGIVAAERILRWLPVGTHDWQKFVRPSELARHLEKNGFCPVDVSGLAFNPLSGEFSVSASDTGVNYFMTAVRK